MDKRRGIVILIFLVLLLGVIDAAWIFSYKKIITASVVGGEKKVYTISQDFGDSLLLNTSNGPDIKSTLMKISDLEEDTNMLFKIETRVTYLEPDCLNGEDCKVTVTQDLINGTEKILSDTDHYNINEEANLTLFKIIENILEYKIECVKNSCPQKINSTIILSQI
jgi:hypothetical protein